MYCKQQFAINSIQFIHQINQSNDINRRSKLINISTVFLIFLFSLVFWVILAHFFPSRQFITQVCQHFLQIAHWYSDLFHCVKLA